MARIHIDLPETFAFATDIPLYLSHINHAGHLDNALLLTVVTEARLRWLKSMGYGELDIEGVGIVIADAALQYKSEAFHGEVMRVEVAPREFNKYGFDLLWRMGERDSGREVARGKTGVVFFDYEARKPVPAPDAFRCRFV